MRQYICYICVLIYIFFTGCEKVIDVDLNSADPEIVIEGDLSLTNGNASVKISKSGSYFEHYSVQKVNNANVSIEDNFGESFMLEKIHDGEYLINNIFPEEGRIYKLKVEYQNKTFEATSTLNPAVPIDSLSFFYEEGFAFIDAGYNVKVHLTDVRNEENYYRLKIFKNDSLKNELDDFIVFDDRLIDGESIEIVLAGKTYDVGDTATIELLSLDKGAYTYFNTFQELITTNPGSAAPANPTSNLSNGALGYFSAWSSDIKTIIIEEVE